MQTKRLVLMLGLFSTVLVNSQKSTTETIQKKVVFIIVDGISADQLKRAKTPFLDSISTSGSFSNAHVGGGKNTYSETPTISAVGYNSLLTGTWANKHNVWGNGIKAPNYNYPTIFKLYKDQYPDGTTAVFSSWLDNRTKLVGDNLEATGHIKIDYAFDGLEYDTINYPHDKQRNFMKLIDYTVADRAASTLLEKAPDLSWVYLEFSDDMGHRFGDSERFDSAIQFEDQLIGKIWQAIKKREEQFPEDWLLVVTTDHGRSEKDGKGHGGQSNRERSTWIVTNSNQTNVYFNEHTPAVVDILPTMVDFLRLNVPLETKREWDGVPLVKLVDAFDLKTQKEGKNLLVSWKHLITGNGKLYLSKTNNFKEGGTDTYKLIQTINLEDGQISIPIKKLPKGFFKLVLETPHNNLNTWVNLRTVN